MSSFDLNDDMLSRMDPDVRKILEEAQTTYADSIRNPAQQQQRQQVDANNSLDGRDDDAERSLDEKFYPQEYRERFLNKDQDQQWSPNAISHVDVDAMERGRSRSKSQNGAERRYSPSNQRSHATRSYAPSIENIDKNSDVAHDDEGTTVEKRRYVVEIDLFASALKQSNRIPSEMEMMLMPYGEIKNMWLLWDEKYNRDQTQFVLRNAFAMGCIMLGFGLHRAAKFFVHDDLMDMRVWAEHWYIYVASDRPGYKPPFDLALMVLLRKLAWLRGIAAGEGSLIMGFIRHMWKEYQAQQKAKADASEKEKEMEERIRSKVFADFEERLTRSNYVPEYKREEPVTAKVDNDISAVKEKEEDEVADEESKPVTASMHTEPIEENDNVIENVQNLLHKYRFDTQSIDEDESILDDDEDIKDINITTEDNNGDTDGANGDETETIYTEVTPSIGESTLSQTENQSQKAPRKRVSKPKRKQKIVPEEEIVDLDDD